MLTAAPSSRERPSGLLAARAWAGSRRALQREQRWARTEWHDTGEKATRAPRVNHAMDARRWPFKTRSLLHAAWRRRPGLAARQPPAAGRDAVSPCPTQRAQVLTESALMYASRTFTSMSGSTATMAAIANCSVCGSAKQASVSGGGGGDAAAAVTAATAGTSPAANRGSYQTIYSHSFARAQVCRQRGSRRQTCSHPCADSRANIVRARKL